MEPRRDCGPTTGAGVTVSPRNLLPDREAAARAHWLRAHAGPDVISRDRATA